MSNNRSQGGSNSEVPEVSSRYVLSLDDIAIHIRRVRKSAPPLFSATIGSIFIEDWTRVMSQNLNVFSIPKSLKVRIACLFLRGEPVVWFERVAQPRMYRWNKFRSSLERNFGSLGANWERNMVKIKTEMLEIVAVIVVIPRKILRRIPRKRLMEQRPKVGCSRCGLDSLNCWESSYKSLVFFIVGCVKIVYYFVVKKNVEIGSCSFK